MTSGSSLQLPERAYSSKPRPGTLGSEATSSRRLGLTGDPVHIHDARGRHATPPVENPVLVETYPHSRPDSRRPLLVTALQNLLRLRVPILYRNHIARPFIRSVAKARYQPPRYNSNRLHVSQI